MPHVCVDLARKQVPISGSAIRSAPHDHAAFLDPVVRASFVARICFLGGESTGKTTLAKTLADLLGEPWVPEYGRELWMERKGDLAFDDMLYIGREQVRREQAFALQASQLLACDTSPLTTLFYSFELFGRAAEELGTLSNRTYDLTVLCGDEFPFVQDGTRQKEAFRQRGQDWYRRALETRGIRYTEARGSVEERREQVLEALRSSRETVD